MRNIKRRRSLVSILLCILIVCTSFSNVLAAGKEELIDYSDMEGWPTAPEINSEAAILIEAKTGIVLYEKNSVEKLYPASITKVMTALVVLENSELDDIVTFSEDAIHDLEEGAFSYMADTGDKLTVRDCLYALLLMSANEAAYALAEHVGRSVDGFSYLMNKKAEELGLENSNFTCPHGLFDENHYTCARDMAKIMKAAMANSTFAEIDSAYEYTTAPTKTQESGYFCRTTHPMRLPGNESYDSRVTAGKTGYIEAAKFNLITYAKSGDQELIAVVMKGESREETCADTETLINYGFGKFSFQPISQTADISKIEKTVEARLGRVVQNVEFSEDARALLPFNAADVKITDKFTVGPNADNADEVYGYITYSFGKHELGRDTVKIKLIPEDAGSQSADKGLIARIMDDIKDDPLLKVLIILVVVLIALLAISIVFTVAAAIVRSSEKKKKERRNKTE